VTRERNRTTGHGKGRKHVTDTWDVVGLEGLSTAGFYGERGSGSHENRNDFRPHPINAVVVVHDPYMETNPHVKTLVILTNGPVGNPLKVYDGYDAAVKSRTPCSGSQNRVGLSKGLRKTARPAFLSMPILLL